MERLQTSLPGVCEVAVDRCLADAQHPGDGLDCGTHERALTLASKPHVAGCVVVEIVANSHPRARHWPGWSQCNFLHLGSAGCSPRRTAPDQEDLCGTQILWRYGVARDCRTD